MTEPELQTEHISDDVKISRIKRFLAHRSARALRIVLISINGLLSLAAVILYVVGAYDSPVNTSTATKYIYLIASFTFLVEYLLQVAEAPRRLSFIFLNWRSYVEIITIAYGLINFWLSSTNGSFFDALRILRLFQVVRIINIVSKVFLLWIADSISPMQMELSMAIFDLMLTLSSVIFLGGCVFWGLEGGDGKPGSPTYIHQAWYWACVTISTIGYGDFYPNTLAGYLLFPVMIIFILVLLPSKISHYSSLLEVYSLWMRDAYTPWRRGRHIVIVGNFTPATIKTFTDELSNPDRGVVMLEVVLLHPDPPTAELMLLMSFGQNSLKFKYLQGSAFTARDLGRAGVTQALAIFVMANKHADDLAEEDSRTLMSVLAVSQILRQYVAEPAGVKTQLYSWNSASWRGRLEERIACGGLEASSMPHMVVQFHLARTIARARDLMTSQQFHPPELGMLPVVSPMFPMNMGSIKHSLIGAALWCPGLLTLICNLCISSDLNFKKLRGQQGAKLLGWLDDYFEGAEHELYELQFPSDYDGLSYAEAAEELYLSHGAVLIALSYNTNVDYGPMMFSLDIAPFESPCRIAAGATVGCVLSPNRLFAADLVRVLNGRAPSSRATSYTDQTRSASTASFLARSQPPSSATPPTTLARSQTPSSATPHTTLICDELAGQGHDSHQRTSALASPSLASSPAPSRPPADTPHMAVELAQRPVRRCSTSAAPNVGTSDVSHPQLREPVDRMLSLPSQQAASPAISRASVPLSPAGTRRAGSVTRRGKALKRHLVRVQTRALVADAAFNPGRSHSLGAHVALPTVDDMLPPMEELVLIIGSSCFHFLGDLVSAIRGSCTHSGPTPLAAVPVVIMDEAGPSAVQQAHIMDVADVMVLLASPLEPGNLRKLNVLPGGVVSAVVMPSRSMDQGVASVGKVAALGDADTIGILSNLRTYCTQAHASLKVVTEVVDVINTAYALPLCFERQQDSRHQLWLDSIGGLSVGFGHSLPTPVKLTKQQAKSMHRSKLATCMQSWPECFMRTRQQQDDQLAANLIHMLGKLPHLSPVLATGHIVVASFLDAMLCQLLFNPMLIQLLMKLAGCWIMEPAASTQDQKASSCVGQDDGAPGTAGPSPAASARSADAGRAAVSPRVHAVPLRHLLHAHKELQVKLNQLVNKDGLTSALTYGELCLHSLRVQRVVLGLYRRDVSTGFPHAVTNASKGTLLRTNDKVYILASSDRVPTADVSS